MNFNHKIIVDIILKDDNLLLMVNIGIRGYSGDTLLNSEAVFEFWGVIFSFMLKEEEKISMVSPELERRIR